MFDTKLFGYDKEQVEAVVDLMTSKIDAQKRDIEYLRIEKTKLEKRLKIKQNNELER